MKYVLECAKKIYIVDKKWPNLRYQYVPAHHWYLINSYTSVRWKVVSPLIYPDMSLARKLADPLLHLPLENIPYLTHTLTVAQFFTFFWIAVDKTPHLTK